jgi:hypothetical protein
MGGDATEEDLEVTHLSGLELSDEEAAAVKKQKKKKSDHVLRDFPISDSIKKEL